MDGLRMVGVCRSSVNHVDVDAATERGIVVVNTPGRNAVSVAELTVGLMISLARRIPEADRMIKEGRWTDPVGPYLSMQGSELKGKNAGIIGLGKVGSEVAARLNAFGVSVLVYDPLLPRDRIKALGAAAVSKQELLRDSDMVTIHCSSTPDALDLIGYDEIALMKPTAFLINTAFWEAVNEEALMKALGEELIAGAAFDTFRTHPVAANHPLLKLENVICTPHIGGATDGTVKCHSAMMFEEIEHFLNGRQPGNLVNPEAWSG
jgi:D-3-phosphoglycerate dehydrogenase